MDSGVILSETRAAYRARLAGGPPWDDETAQLGAAYRAAVEVEAERSGAMRLKHPRWSEFYRRLTDAVSKHGCQAGESKFQANLVLDRMGETMFAEWFDAHGGFCDCEILMNVAPSAVDSDVRQRALGDIND